MSYDIKFPNVSLLINGDGPNNGTSVVEATGKSATVENGVHYSTDVDLCSGSALYFPGGSGRIRFSDDNGFNLSNYDFCIQAVARPIILTNNVSYLISQVGRVSDNNNRGFGLAMTSSMLLFYCTVNGLSDINISVNYSFSVNNIYYLEVDRHNNILYFFVNGTLIGTASISATIFNSTADLVIGSFGKYADDGYQSLSFNGYMAGVRMTVGDYRHAATFTAESLPLPARSPVCTLHSSSARFTDGSIATKAVAFLSGTNVLAGEATPDPITGEFSITVPNQASANFDVAIYRDGYRPLIHGPISATAS